MKAATKVRDMEKTDYDTTHKDYSESVDALERAIAVLKKQAYTRKQATFAQVGALKDLSLIPKEAKKTIEAFLAQEEMNSKHAYDMLMQDLTAQTDQAKQDREEKAETKAKKLQAKADAEGDLTDTTTTRDEDEKYL